MLTVLNTSRAVARTLGWHLRGFETRINFWKKRERFAAVSAATDVPEHLVRLVVLIEDKRFWLHPGTDPIAILRAFLMNTRRTGALQGGSTIPEQLAKTTSRYSKRTFFARCVRSLLAMQLVARTDKMTLLSNYINRVYLGRGAEGLKAGAKLYFARTVWQLTPAECFFLVERIAMPSKFRPPRIRNILRRKAVQDLLGAHILGLPEAYDIGFRTNTEIRTVMQTLLEELNAR